MIIVEEEGDDDDGMMIAEEKFAWLPGTLVGQETHR